MKLIAGMIWYDEQASWLNATIASLARIGVDHLVVIDGGFVQYPNARAQSGFEQAEAIVRTADALGMGLTMHRPKELWYDGEREKRTHLFKLCCAEATIGEDWLFIIDADEVISDGDLGVKQGLANITEDVARAYLWQRPNLDNNPEQLRVAMIAEGAGYTPASQTRFFRALDDMRVEVTHYHYCATKNGVRYELRGAVGEVTEALGYDVAPVHDHTLDVWIEHRDLFRIAGRRAAKAVYYSDREEMGAESLASLGIATDPQTTATPGGTNHGQSGVSND